MVEPLLGSVLPSDEPAIRRQKTSKAIGVIVEAPFPVDSGAAETRPRPIPLRETFVEVSAHDPALTTRARPSRATRNKGRHLDPREFRCGDGDGCECFVEDLFEGRCWCGVDRAEFAVADQGAAEYGDGDAAKDLGLEDREGVGGVVVGGDSGEDRVGD